MQIEKYETVGKAVAEMRKANGLTQSAVCVDLAHVVGMSQGRLSRLEAGKWIPTAGQFEHLINALRCTEEQARELRYLASCAAHRLADAS
jgi:transcriptional regulator with XRE-family HTH domain